MGCAQEKVHGCLGRLTRLVIENIKEPIATLTSQQSRSSLESYRIPLSPEAQALETIRVVSVSDLFGEAIRAIHHHDSVSRLFV